MKLNSLSKLQSINDEIIDYLPFESNGNITPIYKEIKGWRDDLTQLQDLKDAPEELHQYIKWLEDTLEIPIRIVSVGPDRKQTLLS